MIVFLPVKFPIILVHRIDYLHSRGLGWTIPLTCMENYSCHSEGSKLKLTNCDGHPTESLAKRNKQSKIPVHNPENA